MNLWHRFTTALSVILGQQEGTPDAGDDFWYHPLGLQSASGIRVTPGAALSSTAFYAAIRKVSGSVAQLPLFLYRRTVDGKEVARNLPLFEVLHRRPNDRQTSFQFRWLMQAWLEIYGNAYAEIKPGPSGAIDQLLPLSPVAMKGKIKSDGTIFYEFTPARGPIRTLYPQQLLRLSGFSLDGESGMNVIEMQREALGMALGAQDYAARFFKNDARMGFFLTHPKTLGAKAAERLKADLQKLYTGAGRHSIGVLEEGMEPKMTGSTNQAAQMIESRKFQLQEMARVVGLPPHKIGDLERATYSNIEHQALEYVTDTLMERLVQWEQAIGRDLISKLPESDDLFAEHVVAGLLRGDLKSRYEAYAVGRNWGWLSVNEIRALENMNAIPNGDRYMEPLNMVPAGSPRDPKQQEEEARNVAATRAAQLARAAAVRIWRREEQAVAFARSKRSASDFVQWVEAYYIDHAKFIADSLCLEPERAFAYAEERAALLIGGRAEWSNAIPGLISLALTR